MKKLFQLLTSFTQVYAKIALTVSIVAITIFINSSVPLIFKKSIDVLSIGDYSHLYFLLAGYGVVWITAQVMSTIRTYLASGLIEEISGQLTLKLFKHLHSLSLRFHSERQTGILAHALNAIQSSVETLLYGSLLYLVPTLFELVIALCIITYLYGWLYAIILCATFLGFLILNILSAKSIERSQVAYNTHRAAAKANVIESLSHAETVKYFSGYEFEHDQCQGLLEAQKKSSRDFIGRSIIIQNMQSLVISVGLMSALFLTAKGIAHQTLKIADFVLIQNYFLQFMLPLNHLGYLFIQFKRVRIDLKDALQFFDITPEIVDLPDAQALSSSSVTITFDNVSFGYADTLLLKDCSFTITPGKKIAIVGSTGSGKTTLVRLLFRLYDTSQGAIVFNGENIKNITQESLHKLIGYVPQETLLFNNTLYYNITYGQLHKSHEEVIEAVHLAGLDSFIKGLPEGLETKVGNNGVKISGGERQRIALARVILKKPALYIFDEATSALDTATEKTILNNIHMITKNASTITIAHRLSTIVDADEILVLEKGCIVQRGTHQNLLTQPGVYATLWATQNFVEHVSFREESVRERSLS